MKFSRVLLVNPNYSNKFFAKGRAVPRVGLGYIAQVLEESRIKYGVFDVDLGYSFNDLVKRIRVFRPDLIGISMMTFRYKQIYAVAGKLKKIFPDINIVAGGPHVSTLREKVLEDCASIDYAIVLEGDETIIELCKGKNLKKIKGLLWRNSYGKVIYNGDRQFIEDLDRIPFPKYGKFELNKYATKTIAIISSRGCPFNCIYCPVRVAIGRKFRVKSVKNVLNEIRYWYDKGYRNFDFIDDNFTLIRERVERLCGLIMEEGLKDLKLSCPNGVRADRVDRDLLIKMKRAGFWHLAFGVESGSDKILKLMKKGEELEVIEKAIKEACGLGYDVGLFFIFGLPGETAEDINKSVGLALKYPVNDVKFYPVLPYPNTELFDDIEEKGYFIIPPEEYLNRINPVVNNPVFETPELSVMQRKKMFDYLKGVEREVYNRKIRRKFKRFGLAGLIASSIVSSRPFQYAYIRSGLFNRIIYKIKNKGYMKDE
ncbi:hypothetical protein COV19_05470 [Candidatus Woesearchaeota archaeon CG10_big_fil_rev_8_21_14_0_10_44_13]|nr:MAG: hypothetical protein COV19_05470 [Candidatus Woesearchaeota archaeon CG10_big_fil_rev_8_21_14_0_10_44_13]